MEEQEIEAIRKDATEATTKETEKDEGVQEENGVHCKIGEK